MPLKIGELARITGCQTVTVRYYEKEGLLPAPDRGNGNYRLYGDEDVERLRFIRHCRHHGMKLSEIRELLAFKDNPKADCAWINRMIEEHIADVSAQIDSLTHLKGHLEALLKTCAGNKSGDCCILQNLNRADNCPYCEDARCRLEQISGRGKW